MITRRGLLGSLIGAAAGSSFASVAPNHLAGIEASVGGRLGLYAVNTDTGQTLERRPDERFAMCSTYKWLLAAAVLANADGAMLSLDDRVAYGSKDLLAHAPVTRQNVAGGSMSVSALLEAAVTVSDNTAANLLLARIGGPSGLSQFVRALNDSVTRLDRQEPSLNSNDSADPRDTTSPRAMVALMRQVLCGDVLAPASRDRLLGWLRASKTGSDRLRAGLPRSWVVGDKTGSGRRGAVNDVAIAIPPGGAPILIAAYLSEGNSELAAEAHVDIGRLVARELWA